MIRDLLRLPRTNARNPFTPEEYRRLAVKIAESGLTQNEFIEATGIPEHRARRAVDGYSGLIRQIRKEKGIPGVVRRSKADIHQQSLKRKASR